MRRFVFFSHDYRGSIGQLNIMDEIYMKKFKIEETDCYPVGWLPAEIPARFMIVMDPETYGDEYWDEHRINFTDDPLKYIREEIVEEYKSDDCDEEYRKSMESRGYRSFADLMTATTIDYKLLYIWDVCGFFTCGITEGVRLIDALKPYPKFLSQIPGCRAEDYFVGIYVVDMVELGNRYLSREYGIDLATGDIDSVHTVLGELGTYNCRTLWMENECEEDDDADTTSEHSSC